MATHRDYKGTRNKHHEVARPPIRWRGSEVSHRKKDCTKVMYWTNYRKNNHVASCCRQPFREVCKYHRRTDLREEESPSYQ